MLTDFYTFLKGVFWRFKLIAVILHVEWEEEWAIGGMGIMGMMGEGNNERHHVKRNVVII